MGDITDLATVTPLRHVTLEAARAMECNGCGDCCDSRRTDGHWAWSSVPHDLFEEMVGEPLIIPLERVGDGWRDRPHEDYDVLELIPTLFRCAALQPQEDGRALCGRHTEARPAVCGEFPVWGPDVEQDLASAGEAHLATSFLPRCTWLNVVVVRDDDPRLAGE